MRIGVYVGSFNPPHNGHIHVVDYLLANNIVDKVLILPTLSYWDKEDLIDIEKRVEMLKFYEKDKVEVDNTHNKYEYTYQVLNSISLDNLEDELYLIIGSDNLEKLHLWKNIEEILKNKIIVLSRGKIEENENLKGYQEQFIYIDNFDYLDISSTYIRNNINGNIEGLINEKVLKYIKENHLYNS